MPMRPLARLAVVTVVVGCGPVLSACDTVQNTINAMEGFEIWDSKKKISGERKPVFPEGVPGVSTGVPPEIVRGYREPEQGGPVDPARAAAEAAAADQQPKPKPKPQRTAAKPPPKPSSSPKPPADPYASAPGATPAQASQPAPQATAPWPSAQPQAAQQAPWPGQQGTVAR
jgi:hypothetical protein